MTYPAALDFIVVNTRTGNACAAFMIRRDALHYIKWRRESEGPNGPSYEIRNEDVEPAPPPTPASADGDTTVSPVVPPTLV